MPLVCGFCKNYWVGWGRTRFFALKGMVVKMDRVLPIRQNTDFKKAYYRGKYKAHPFFVTYLVRNSVGYARLGITTSKKIGKAVERNRARRILKEAYRCNLSQLLPLVQNGGQSFDVVLMARAEIAHKKSTDLAPIVKQHILSLRTQKPAKPNKAGAQTV